MKSAEEYKVSSSLAVLLVGEPKSGKTCVAAAFPDPYFLDVDGNLASAVRIMRGKKFWYDSIVSDVKAMKDVYKKGLECLTAAKADPNIKTIVIDSISLYVEYICQWMVDEHVRMGNKDKNGKAIEAMTLPDYGKLLSILRTIVFDIRSSGKYVVVTSHQSSSKDELTGAMRYALALPGQSKDTFGGCFTDVWATNAVPMPGGKTKYEIRTRPTGFHVALGTSIRSLDAAIDITDKDPTQIWSILSPKLSAPAPAA